MRVTGTPKSYIVVAPRHHDLEDVEEQTESALLIRATGLVHLMHKLREGYHIYEEDIISIRRMRTRLAHRINDEWLASLPEEELSEYVRERLELDGR